MATSVGVQKQIDDAVSVAVKTALASTVAVASKPDLIQNLRKTWRGTAEHKAAQVKLFLSTFFGMVVLQAIGDFASGKDLSHLADRRALLTYLAPVALVAWRQIHPALTASQADSAQGVTIVPTQVALPDPAVPDPAVPDPVVPDPAVVDPPVVDPGVPVVPEGDAAP